jgi:hypothetical protein
LEPWPDGNQKGTLSVSGKHKEKCDYKRDPDRVIAGNSASADATNEAFVMATKMFMSKPPIHFG